MSHASSRLHALFTKTGYLLWLVQFLWLVLAYFETARRSGLGQFIIPDAMPKPAPEPAAQPVSFEPNALLVFAAMVASGLMIVFVIYLVTRRYVPAVTATTEETVNAVTDQTVQRLAKAYKLPARQQRKLGLQVRFWLQIALTILPVIILWAWQPHGLVGPEVAVVFSALLALLAMICFLLARFVAPKRGKST